MILYKNIRQCVTLLKAKEKQGRNTKAADLSIVENASVVVNEDNTILWVGPTPQLPQAFSEIEEKVDCSSEIWVPGFVECHTHLVFGGERSKDYHLKAQGLTYQEIALQGGGIASTLLATRQASLNELVAKSLESIRVFEKQGVKALEIKSGYGLDLENEFKILEAIQILQTKSSIKLVPTFLPAHAVPPEFKNRANDYVELICKEWLGEVAKRKWAYFFDVFIEAGFFSLAQTRILCEKALEYGYKIKLHTDQFTDQGGIELGLRLNATSLDHLETISDTNIRKLANSNTVAVLCPGASLFTHYPFPPARKLIDSGAIVALSTDYNPGTCPSRNIFLMMTLACSQMKLTMPESLVGFTYNAAQALGLQNELGTIEAGKKFAVFRKCLPSYYSLAYSFGELLLDV